jgi:predicted amidohydrolase
MYDLLLKGGTVVDPSAGLDGVHDIAVEHGRSRASRRIFPRPRRRGPSR